MARPRKPSDDHQDEDTLKARRVLRGKRKDRPGQGLLPGCTEVILKEARKKASNHGRGL